MGWKDEIARTITGERTELKTLPGHFIVARKFSVGIADQIKAVERRIAAASPELSAAAIKYANRADGNADAPAAEIMADLPNEIKQKIMLETGEAQVKYGSQLCALVLKGGIADHDFLDDAGNKATVDDDFVATIQENQVLTDEMVAIIREWNGPFGRSGPARSAMPPSGSAAEPT